jgi:hypothetical protein
VADVNEEVVEEEVLEVLEVLEVVEEVAVEESRRCRRWKWLRM